MRLTIDVSDLRRAAGQWASFAKVFPQGIDDALERVIGPAVLNDLAQGTPVSDREDRTHAQDLWSIAFVGSFRSGTGTIELENSADYLKYVIGGAEPHIITGNPKLAFYWVKVGEMFYGTSVEHPGQEAQDFISPIIEDRTEFAVEELNLSIAKSLTQTIF